MGISENDRFRLHRKLNEVLGTDEASTMMELFPPRDWTDIARRSDLDNLRTEMRAEMIALRSDFSLLRSDLDAFRAEVHAAISELRGNDASLSGEVTSLRSEFDSLRAEFGGLRSEFEGFKTSMILATVASAASAWGLLLAALALR